jgi:hypothetical protein
MTRRANSRSENACQVNSAVFAPLNRGSLVERIAAAFPPFAAGFDTVWPL